MQACTISHNFNFLLIQNGYFQEGDLGSGAGGGMLGLSHLKFFLVLTKNLITLALVGWQSFLFVRDRRLSYFLSRVDLIRRSRGPCLSLTLCRLGPRLLLHYLSWIELSI